MRALAIPCACGFCARTLTSAVAPFAIANKMGWFAGGAFKVELVPLAGSVDCVKFVGTGELRYALPSIEPLAGIAAARGHREIVLYRLSGQHLFDRGAGRQPDQDAR